jgi:hypothetical protein
MPLCGVGTTCFPLPFSYITRHLHTSFILMPSSTVHPSFLTSTSTRYITIYNHTLSRIHNTSFTSAYFALVNCECVFNKYHRHHYNQPINVPTAGAQAFLMDHPQGERAITHHAGPMRIGA